MTDTNEQPATDTTTIAANSVIKRPRKMAREPKAIEAGVSSSAQASPTPIKPESKASLILSLLQRPEGATLDQLVTATGWLPHTTRAALTGLKKKGHVITSEKLEGHARVYRAVTA